MAEVLQKSFPTGLHACHACLQNFDEWLAFEPCDPQKLRTHDGTLIHSETVRYAKNEELANALELERHYGIKGKTPFFLDNDSSKLMVYS